jgi:hypothetical protein
MTVGNAQALLRLDFDDFAPLVVAALRAGAVRELAFVAIRALGERARGQEIMRTPARAARLGVSPFRIRHNNLFWAGGAAAAEK